MTTNNTNIKAVVGRAEFYFPDAHEAAKFAREYEQGELPTISHEPPPAALVQTASHVVHAQPAAPAPTRPRTRSVGRAGGDALDILLTEIERAADQGVMQSWINETRFNGQRHGSSNALKRLGRICQRLGMNIDEVVTRAEENRSQRLRPGPRFAEYRSRTAGEPAVATQFDDII